MSYTTYTTEALVCGSFARNTADASHLLFTKRAGMLYATARSVREERSKQRFALPEFSYVRVSLVKGKSGWRIGSIEPIKNFYFEAIDQKARGSVVSIIRLLRRLYSGEEPAEELFDYLLQAVETLAQSTAHRKDLEQLIVARLLLSLGYIDEAQVPPEVKGSLEEQANYIQAQTAPLNLSSVIDKALLSSQL